MELFYDSNMTVSELRQSGKLWVKLDPFFGIVPIEETDIIIAHIEANGELPHRDTLAAERVWVGECIYLLNLFN
jgi:hypothetical protein